MKIWFISDTHGKHDQLIVPDCDAIIHAGDFSNWRDTARNSVEVYDFLDWWTSLSITNKILIAGNHDTSIENKLIRPKEMGLIYLEHESCEIGGLKIFGSPYTPTFGNWAFNVPRHKLDSYWKEIPTDTDILVTHGPPKGILDLSENRDGVIEQCGCKSLLNHVMSIEPKVHVFGHIHNFKDCINQGQRRINKTLFINASCVTDREFHKPPSSNGVLVEL